MNFQIKNRFSGAVQFECELSAEIAGKEYSMQLGFAVKKAMEAGAYLTGANLAGAYLTGANLTGAYLTGANLTGAYLTGANLAGAYLTGAYLTDANLAGAYLTGAYLTGANLTGAYLTGAYLTDAKWRDLTIQRIPLQLFGLDYQVFILDQHMQIGCELHALDDWRGFSDRRIIEMDGAKAAKFWRAHKDALLALASSDGRGVAKETKEDAPC